MTTEGRPLGLAWRIAAWPAVLVTHAVVSALAATWRYEVVGGREILERLRAEPEPILACTWHESLYPGCAWFLRGPLRQALRLGLMVSRSRDGELVSRLLRLWGAVVVRGSSSDGGREGLRALHRAVTREGVSPLSLPDGPRGPARRAKPGVLVLAAAARIPVVPFGFRVRRCFRLRSWDRIVMPMPFARIEVHVGEPMRVEPNLDPEAERALAERLTRALDEAAGAGS